MGRHADPGDRCSTGLFNFFSNITFSIFLVYAVRVLELGAGTIGVLFALGNVGGLAAALLARRISRGSASARRSRSALRPRPR